MNFETDEEPVAARPVAVVLTREQIEEHAQARRLERDQSRARALQDLSRVGDWGGYQSQWLLRTADTIEAVLDEPGYFRRFGSMGIRHGDRVDVVAGDMNPLLCTYATAVFDVPERGAGPVTIAILTCHTPTRGPSTPRAA